MGEDNDFVFPGIESGILYIAKDGKYERLCQFNGIETIETKNSYEDEDNLQKPFEQMDYSIEFECRMSKKKAIKRLSDLAIYGWRSRGHVRKKTLDLLLLKILYIKHKQAVNALMSLIPSKEEDIENVD